MQQPAAVAGCVSSPKRGRRRRRRRRRYVFDFDKVRRCAAQRQPTPTNPREGHGPGGPVCCWWPTTPPDSGFGRYCRRNAADSTTSSESFCRFLTWLRLFVLVVLMSFPPIPLSVYISLSRLVTLNPTLPGKRPQTRQVTYHYGSTHTLDGLLP